MNSMVNITYVQTQFADTITNLEYSQIDLRFGNELQLLRSLSGYVSSILAIFVMICFWWPHQDPDIPYLWFILGQTFTLAWFFGFDEHIVISRLPKLEKGAIQCVIAASIKIIMIIPFVLIGLLARIQSPNILNCIPGEHCEAVCDNSAGCSNLGMDCIEK